VALLGNLDGVHLPGRLKEKKKYIWVTFLGQGHYDFKSGPSGTVSKGTGLS
jgi:hypothetical protein